MLAYDARGHGRSGGETTLGHLEQHDVAAAVDAVRGDDREMPVVIVGASMGAIAALRYAVSPSRPIDGVVVVSCPARWRLPRNARGLISALVTQTNFGRRFATKKMGVRIAPRAPRAAPPIELVPKVHVPLAILHGRVDPFIAPAEAEALFAVAHEPRRLDLVDGLAHAFDPADKSAGPIVAAVEWALASR